MSRTVAIGGALLCGFLASKYTSILDALRGGVGQLGHHMQTPIGDKCCESLMSLSMPSIPFLRQSEFAASVSQSIDL